ncbi:MAG: transketolase C-terminal domain-containing protein [Solirubrobacteraceae bacterium]
MNAIQTLVEQSGGESRPPELGHPRDQAIALAVDRCRPLVIRSSATPGGHVIAAAIDACASGRSVYTTTNGEGLLRMAPALFRASHLGLPIVMTVESPSGPSDHGHAMALRDCGWVQLYPSDDQDAVDTHIQAFRIAESLSLPVMVCTDTFTGAHSVDRPLAPSAEEINAFLERGDWPPPARSISAGETPDMQLEMRYLTHAKQGVALETIRQVGADFRAHFGRRSGGVLTAHRLCAAKLAVLGLGSTFEAITTAVDDVRGHGVSVGAVGLRSFRPFPTQDVGAALLHCERVVIVERAVAVGIGGIVATDVRSALARLPVRTHTVIAGLGNRAISPESLQRALYRALHGNLEELSFLDVNR